MDWLELVAVAFGIVSVWLSVRQNIWSWPTAIVNVLLYFVIFRRERFYALMTLQLFYAAVSAYGWYHWRFGGEGRTVLRVSRTPMVLRWALPAAGVLATVGLGALLAGRPDARIPYLDAGLTVASLTAMWMMSRKYLENWAVWIAVDVVSIATFSVQGLWLTAVLYAAFLVLASMGHVEWARSWRADRAPTPAPAPA